MKVNTYRIRVEIGYFMGEYRIRANFSEFCGNKFLEEFNEFVDSLRTEPRSCSVEWDQRGTIGDEFSGFVLLETDDPVDAFSMLLRIDGAFVVE